jgi:putative membrane protein
MSTVIWSAVASALHVLALGIGLGAAVVRGRALRGVLDEAGVKRVLAADNLYGIAALLWIGTGIWRAFGSAAKGPEYYLHNAVFFTKLGLFVAVLWLEVWPMVTFIRWRMARGRGQKVDVARGRLLGAFTYIEVVLIVVIVFLAAMMARGIGQLD